MRVLVVGSGAREHALAQVVSQQGVSVYSAGAWLNPALSSDRYLAVSPSESQKIVDFAQKRAVDLIIVGGEDALAAGVVDLAQKAGIAAFGPTKNLAQLETSKSYSRDLLKAHALDINPFYQRVQDIQQLKKLLDKLGNRYVLKADGLCGGKGVKLAGEHLNNHREAIEFAKQLLSRNSCLVVEELLEGQEFSLFSLADQSACVHFPLAQDHKRAFEGDEGPNTGGMGSYSMNDGSLPFVHSHILKAAQMVNERVLEILASEHQQPFRGVLYGSFMITSHGLRLIEYNVRFGDPEVMNFVNLYKGDWLQLFEAVCHDRLAHISPVFEPYYSVCCYVVPQGYPEKPVKNQVIELEEGLDSDLRCYYGSLLRNAEGQLLLQGSRALAYVAVSKKSLQEAQKKVVDACQSVSGPVFYRSDIASAASLKKKIAQIEGFSGFVQQ